MGGDRDFIYHIVPRSELRAGTKADWYWPARFASDGFVHCSAGPEQVLAVAEAIFRSVGEPLLLLQIDCARLSPPVVHEAADPAQPPGLPAGAHAERFPHVYGPIDLDAIAGVGVLELRGERFAWPEQFAPLLRELPSREA